MYSIENKSNSRKRQNLKKSNHLFNKNFIALTLTVLLAFVFVIGIKLVDVSANKSGGDLTKEYMSVEIKEGDTLWTLAKEYMGVGYSDVDDYIDDIKSVNGLATDTIHEGNNIIIPMYVSSEQ